MRSDIVSGIIAGLIGGVFFGIADDECPHTPRRRDFDDGDGRHGRTVRQYPCGLALSSVYSAFIGAIFGWLFGRRLQSFAAGLGWGAAYGFVWWIMGALILMPVFLGMLPLEPLIMEPMRTVALGSLLGHLIYGIILGGSFVMMKQRILGVPPQNEPRETGGTDSLRRLSKQPKGDNR